MKDLLDFMGEHPWLILLFSLLIAQIAWGVLYCLPSRLIRHFNVRKAGWPPPHLDADGDFKSENKDDEP